jgi:DNA-binding NarL/FixJ family response regulator
LADDGGKALPENGFLRKVSGNMDNEGIGRKTVLVLENGQVLGAGLHHLLRETQDLKVIGIKSIDQTELLEIVNRIQPEVIVLDISIQSPDVTSLLAILLDQHAKIRLVVVNLDGNSVSVYDKFQTEIRRVSDFFHIFR